MFQVLTAVFMETWENFVQNVQCLYTFPKSKLLPVFELRIP